MKMFFPQILARMEEMNVALRIFIEGDDVAPFEKIAGGAGQRKVVLVVRSAV